MATTTHIIAISNDAVTGLPLLCTLTLELEAGEGFILDRPELKKVCDILYAQSPLNDPAVDAFYLPETL